jgi:hypothetical protein
MAEDTEVVEVVEAVPYVVLVPRELWLRITAAIEWDVEIMREMWRTRAAHPDNLDEARIEWRQLG